MPRTPRPAARHDPVVLIDHALNLLPAAHAHGLDVEAQVFAQAGHGFGLRALDGTLDGTLDPWPALAARWRQTRLMARHTG